MTSVPGFDIKKKISHHNNIITFSGVRLADKRPVIIKTHGTEYPRAREMARLTHEYELTKDLSVPGIFTPIGMEQSYNGLVLILDAGDNDPMKLTTVSNWKNSHAMSLSSFLLMAIDLSDTLGELHKNNVIHKNVNPDNVIINMDSESIWINDFSIASMLPEENTRSINPTIMEGTLAYMAPEQTGRMNRTIDYRSDFYSLGVTLYETLIARLPFPSTDPLALVHAHIAKIPPIPHHIDPAVPREVSQIIMKLMAKRAEDRYQSAVGLTCDLKKCLGRINGVNRIAHFELGQEDVSEKFRIPQQLYGRERETRKLLSAFDRVSQGDRQLFLVTGYAGIGKSSLVQEVRTAIIEKGGHFISGKFDQYKRNIPYASVIEAFSDLVKQILYQRKAHVAQWKKKILRNLGPNGQIITDVIPEVTMIIGRQPSVPRLPPNESRNRFNRVFQKFVQTFAAPDHPLVLFLDDLQWADAPTLQLIALFLSDPDVRHMLIISAYRDKEVVGSHPVMVALNDIRNLGATVHTLTLGTLDQTHVRQLLSDTLKCDPKKCIRLAELCLQKTMGNPFFLNQFLHALYARKLLVFDAGLGSWQWDIHTIRNSEITDNVVDLMVGKIEDLPAATQNGLKFAACVGNQFDLNTLSIVTEHAPLEIARDLWRALEEGLILPISEHGFRLSDLKDYSALPAGKLDAAGRPVNEFPKHRFKFLHDRVQQAAYSLIRGKDKKEVHYKIGRLMLENTTSTNRNERLFDILGHLNFSTSLIKDSEERQKLANLNLVAAQKAKAGMAFDPALKYLAAGVGLLDDDSWRTQYPLTFALHLELSECQNLIGNFDAAEALFDETLQHARTNLDKAKVYDIKIVMYMTRGQLRNAVSTGISALKLFGLDMPTEPSRAEINREIAEVTSKLRKRPIDLVHLPAMTDPNRLATMRLLSKTLLSTWYVNNDLNCLFAAKMTNLSLTHGNAEDSVAGYCMYGGNLGSVFGDYKTGYEFGELALALNEKLNHTQFIPQLATLFCAFVQPWRFHLKTGTKLLKKAYATGIEMGDYVWAGIVSYCLVYRMILKGDSLDDVLRESQLYLDIARQTKQTIPIHMNLLSQRFVLCLKGETEKPESFSGDGYDEMRHVWKIENGGGTRPIYWYHNVKLQSLYIFEFYHEALDIARAAARLIEAGASIGTITVPEHYFFYSLTLTALYPAATHEDKTQYLEILHQNLNKMATWADNCKENFRHKYLLVAAEIARVTGDDIAAIEKYNAAVDSARENGFVQNEALANELAARFWLSKNRKSYARLHMEKAHRGYQRWGAKRKVAHIEKKYAALVIKPVASMPVADPTRYDTLDLATMMKASQTISSEIVLDRLLAKLIEIVIESAGAQFGYLILESGGNLLVEAYGSASEEKPIVRQSLPLKMVNDLSPAIVNYVAKTREYVVLNDAAREGFFSTDSDVKTRRPRSVMCAPIILKSGLVGILYLENKLVSGAFTPERIEILKFLNQQIAISIENAELYGNLERHAEEIKIANTRMNREIFERKAAEEKYRSIFDNAVEGIFQTSPEGRIIAANPAMARMLGYESAEELIEKTTDIKNQHYVRPGDRERFLGRINENKIVSGFEVQYYRKNGSKIWVSLHARPVNDANNRLHYIEGIISDITTQKNEEKALRESEEYLRKENIRLRANIKDRFRFGKIIGKSSVMQRVYELILRAAASDANVIIYGESGTGKELVSRAIHDLSDRKDKAFVPVNSGAIPRALLESEFFGYKKGAFTGANMDKQGYLDQADKGTLFLDELGELDLSLQVKLLRAIEGGGYTPVGGTQIMRPNVRIIAATNRNFQEQLKKGTVRKDFYYRIHIIPIYLPPLRERKEDIPLLVEQFLKSCELEKDLPPITGKMQEAMMRYDWPGNVRELQNTIHRYVTLKTIDFLGEAIEAPPVIDHFPDVAVSQNSYDYKSAMLHFEKELFCRALEKNQWHRENTAASLGIPVRTFFRKLKNMGITRNRDVIQGR